MISECAENGIIAEANVWSVSLVLFYVGEWFSPLFIITQQYYDQKYSEIFYFSAAAEKAFIECIKKYRRIEKENKIEIF